MRRSADRPGAASTSARRLIIEQAASGDTRAAHAGLDSNDDRVRATALATLERSGELSADVLSRLGVDTSHRVRRRVAEMLARHPEWPLGDLLEDGDDRVVETACWAAGERGSPEPVPLLAGIAIDHRDALCRESAVAALGAIGDPRGLDAILAALRDRATVRRRAVLALAPFDDPRVDEALRAALEDRDWQVRQAAEDLS